MADRKKDFLWRYQPPQNSDKARMLAYIQNRDLHPSQDKTAMIVAALSAFYMPLALHCEGNYQSKYLELLLLDSANAFSKQIQYICTALNIDLARVGEVLCNNFPITLPSRSIQTGNRGEELDEFELQGWNLTGITTDSETFS